MRCRKLKINFQGKECKVKKSKISRGCETPALCFVIDLIQKMTLGTNGYDISRQVPKGNNLPSCTDSTPHIGIWIFLILRSVLFRHSNTVVCIHPINQLLYVRIHRHVTFHRYSLNTSRNDFTENKIRQGKVPTS